MCEPLGRALSVSLVLTLAAGCAGPPGVTSSESRISDSTAAPGTKRVLAAVKGSPHTLYNKLNFGNAEPGIDTLDRLVNAGLTQDDHQANLRAQLAAAVPSLENGLWVLLADGRMETTWKIQKEAHWHDGTPFTAEDVLFSVKVAQDRDLPEFRNAAYLLTESIEAPDLHTVVVRWKSPFVDADGLFTTPALPRHLLERAYTENKAGFTQLGYWTEEFVGAGPFRLHEWARGSHTILRAFDAYLLGRPKIDEIHVQFIPDGNTLMANILAGSVELTLSRTLSIDQALQIRDSWRDGRIVTDYAEGYPRVGWVHFYPQFINPNPGILTDLRFRRALLHAVNRQEIVETVMMGTTSVAHSIVSPAEAEYRALEPNIVKYDYDPRRTGLLIEELGYRRGPDGIFRDGAGQKLAADIRTFAIDLNQKALFPVADYWQRVGVEMEPLVIPMQRSQDAEYRATFPGLFLERLPTGLGELKNFHSREARLPERGYQGSNRARYVSSELDALIDRYVVTIPKAERLGVAGQILRHMTEQLHITGLVYDARPAMIGNRLRNLYAGGVGSNQAWNAHNWDVAS